MLQVQLLLGALIRRILHMLGKEQRVNAERRAHERVELLSSIQYAVVWPSSETGLIKNISKKGLCIVLDRRLPEGTVLRVAFDLPGDKPEHIEGLVEVVWVRAVGNKFSAGVKFITE